jgi:hypothetical protein
VVAFLCGVQELCGEACALDFRESCNGRVLCFRASHGVEKTLIIPKFKTA